MKKTAELTLADITRLAVKKLSALVTDNPESEARILIARALGIDRAQLLVQETRILTSAEIKKIQSFIDRRACHEPLARILGEREFWGLPFGLNESTLEPRPDSETVIEAVLTEAKSYKPEVSILDIGTGTGCLLLSLLYELPQATGIGVDNTPRAIEQAQLNAERLGLSNRVKFIQGHWLEGIKEKFDIIVCNPPYIATADIPKLMPEVRSYDPVGALDGGADGLDAYRFLIPQLPLFLNPDGLAVFECGQGQSRAVQEMLNSARLVGIATFKDLSGIERCVAARAPKFLKN